MIQICVYSFIATKKVAVTTPPMSMFLINSYKFDGFSKFAVTPLGANCAGSLRRASRSSGEIMMWSLDGGSCTTEETDEQFKKEALTSKSSQKGFKTASRIIYTINVQRRE